MAQVDGFSFEDVCQIKACIPLNAGLFCLGTECQEARSPLNIKGPISSGENWAHRWHLGGKPKLATV